VLNITRGNRALIGEDNERESDNCDMLTMYVYTLYCKFDGHCLPVISRNTGSLVGDAGYILTKALA
jgi:hypothetical protein